MSLMSYDELLNFFQVAASEVDPELEETKPQKLGFVTKIIEKRHNRQCVGVFEAFTKEHKKHRNILFIPNDQKMPVIKIPMQNWPNALLVKEPRNVEKVIYLAEIMQWKKSKAIGNIIKSFGQCGELEAETAAILASNGLDTTPFPDTILTHFSEMEFEIPKEEYEKRENLTQMCIFTIDPATARDLDDALSVKSLDNGNIEIGVHISGE